MARRGAPKKSTMVDFGDKSWVVVQSQLGRYARYKYAAVDSDIVEEALQDAVVDGMTYWQSLPSSHSTDVVQNFNYACWRGKLFLGRRIGFLCEERVMLPYDVQGTFWDRVDPDYTPEEVADELDLAERARRVLASLPEAELREHFDCLLTGRSVMESARVLGVSERTVKRRRAASRDRLREASRPFGL